MKLYKNIENNVAIVIKTHSYHTEMNELVSHVDSIQSKGNMNYLKNKEKK